MFLPDILHPSVGPDGWRYWLFCREWWTQDPDGASSPLRELVERRLEMEKEYGALQK